MSSSANRQTAATKGGSGTTPTPANSDSTSRRRSSATLFSGLMNQKRNSSDEAATARKAGFAEQKPAGNFMGNLWNSLTKPNTS